MSPVRVLQIPDRFKSISPVARARPIIVRARARERNPAADSDVMSVTHAPRDLRHHTRGTAFAR
jgi:hypothetical protein